MGERWRSAAADEASNDAALEAALAKFQDPGQADKLLKIQQELDDTKIVLHKTIDSVLARGEKLDNLVEKSSDLSRASQLFYRQAKKARRRITAAASVAAHSPMGAVKQLLRSHVGGPQQRRREGWPLHPVPAGLVHTCSELTQFIIARER